MVDCGFFLRVRCPPRSTRTDTLCPDTTLVRSTTASVGNAVTRIAPDAEVAGCRPVDADDLGAHVGQHHGAKRTGPDPGHLDDPVAGQWSHPALSCLPDPDGSFSKIQNEPLRSDRKRVV